MIALFDDAGFILGGYVITFGILGGLVWRTISSGRRLGNQIPDDEKYWT